jgi:peptidoglycan hydrolase CwlO-like protein
MENSLGTVTADNANNTSKIGNALKAMGMLATGSGWMREDNKVATTTGKIGDKLSTINNLSSTLTDITNDVKSATEQIKTLDKEQKAKDKSTKEGEIKAKEKHEDSTVPDADKIKATIS